jgi:hypothetical protein
MGVCSWNVAFSANDILLWLLPLLLLLLLLLPLLPLVLLLLTIIIIIINNSGSKEKCDLISHKFICCIMCPTVFTQIVFVIDYYIFFLPMPPHVHIDFVIPPPGCGRSVTDFWGWGAHRARLLCPDDDMCECGVPAGALNPSSTSYPDHGRCRDLPLQRKIPTAETRIELGSHG